MEEIDPTPYGVVGYHVNVAFGRIASQEGSVGRNVRWGVGVILGRLQGRMMKVIESGNRERESRIQGGIAKASMISLDFSSRVCEGGSLEVVGGA